jgi:hypothetical protein
MRQGLVPVLPTCLLVSRPSPLLPRSPSNAPSILACVCLHTSSMSSQVRYMIWNRLFDTSTSNEGTAINVGLDEVSSERAVDYPVRPFAVDFDYNDLSILTTCKSVYDEAKLIFWCKSTSVFCTIMVLHRFLEHGTVVRGARVFTNLANIQHVRLTNVEANDVQHSVVFSLVWLPATISYLWLSNMTTSRYAGVKHLLV